MEPYYFGPADRPLFGVYHPPAPEAERDVAVLLCQPVGQEYIRAHRAFAVLASRLAENGFHVLRFDWSGEGDSADRAGSTAELEAWRSDATAALRELAEGTGAARLALVGLRLGAALAASCLAERSNGDGPVEALVLWDPVVDGAAHLSELRAQQAAWLRGSFAKPPAEGEEILGFPLTPSLSAGLGALDLCALAGAPARRALLLASQGAAPSGLAAHLERLGVGVEERAVPTPPVWLKQEDEMGNILVPAELLDGQIAWLSEVFS